MSACVSAKAGGMFASSGAVLAVQDATGAMSYVETYGIVGILVIIALVLWAKSERQEKAANEYRESREKREREEQRATIETLMAITNALNNLRDHCAAIHRRDE